MSHIKILLLIVISILIIGLLSATLFYYQKSSVSPKDKYKILMVGRSTTDLWFRYWNLPGWLNKISVWHDWHIPYKKYVKEGIYFEYMEISSPKKNLDKAGISYGQEIYNSIIKKLENENFDALSFKFCFVDFDDKKIRNNKDAEQRFKNMAALIHKLHAYSQSRHMKLILQNALPSFKPSEYGQLIRLELNKWILEFAANNEDVIQIELYNNLINEDGKLKREFSIEPKDKDSHINMLAFAVLESEFLTKVQKLKDTE